MSDLYLESNHKSRQIKKYWFIHHFLPHEKNRHRSGFVSHRALSFYILAFIFLIMGISFVPKILPGILGYASNIYVNDLIRETNQQRQRSGLGTLTLNPTLSKAAEKKAEHMFANGYWAHVAPDGTQPWDFIVSQGYDYSFAGENLAKNFNNSTDVVRAWMNSPTHKENILNENYSDVGFAVVNGVLDGYETTLVVQMFGKQRGTPQLAAVPLLTDQDAAFVESPLASDTIPADSAVLNDSEEESTEEYEGSSVPTSVVFDAGGVATDPVIDIETVTRSISFIMGGFVTTLLGLDVWYSKKKAIPKVTGHTVAHLALFIMIILGLMLVITPGKVL